MSQRQVPLLFLDVDGPLIPFGAPSQEYPTYRTDIGGTEPAFNPLLTRVNPGHGPRLAALPCELVWATTWGEDANECVAPLLGLPRLPVVDQPEPDEPGGRAAWEEADTRAGRHWKTRVLVGLAAGRPFAWVDDEIGEADRDWVSEHHPGRALLHRVDPRKGLVEGDFRVLGEALSWLREEAEAVDTTDLGTGRVVRRIVVSSVDGWDGRGFSRLR
ncbi:HAD domain-containing protein [Streptomyces sp. NPDC054863]